MVILKTSSDPRSQDLGVQPYRTAPHHLKCGSSPVFLVDQLWVWRFQRPPPNQDAKSKCRPHCWPAGDRSEAPMTPPWVPLTFESSSQITGKCFLCLLASQRTQMDSQMEETLGEVWWSSWAPLHCWADLSPSTSTGPPAQKRSCTRPCPWGVAGGSTVQGRSIINSPFSAPLSSQEKVEGGNEDAKRLNVGSCFLRPFPSRSHPGSAL